MPNPLAIYTELMKIASIDITGRFKRFDGLHLEELPQEARMVILVGPNGSGKSSLFDAMLYWASRRGRRNVGGPDDYYKWPGEQEDFQISIKIHGQSGDAPNGQFMHMRSAYRYTPSIRMSGFSRTPTILDEPAVYKMIDSDTTATRHYQYLVGSFVELLSDLGQERKLKEVRQRLRPLADAVSNIFPDLKLEDLGNPLNEGSFFFSKGAVKGYRYDNLSSGEKAAFDLLLDLYLSSKDFGRGIICLDEPEAHLNPKVQSKLVDEILAIVPKTCQVWVATHSVGFLRRSMQLHHKNPDEIVFIDFSNPTNGSPVTLKPKVISRQFWKETLKVALDDLAELVGPDLVCLCEGNAMGKEGENISWDAKILRRIFGNDYPEIEFVSVGGKGDLINAANTYATAVTPGSKIIRLRDRDDLTDEGRLEMLNEDKKIRILSRRSLENYLVDEEIIKKLVDKYGDKNGNAVTQILSAINTSHTRSKKMDAGKPVLGVVWDITKKVVKNNGQLGENKHQFAHTVLAPLVSKDTDVYKALLSDLQLL